MPLADSGFDGDLEEHAALLTDTPVTRHGVSTAMRVAGGVMTSSQLNMTCAAKRGLYSIPQVPRGVGAVDLDPAESLTCAGFRNKFLAGQNSGVASIEKSFRLTEVCQFSQIEMVVKEPNVLIDCNNSIFDGANTLQQGLSFDMNPTNSGSNAAERTIIHDFEVRNCTFQNFQKNGMFFANQFNRANMKDQQYYSDLLSPFTGDLDEPGESSTGGTYLREMSPYNITVSNVRVKNAPANMGIYIQNHVRNVAIDNVTVTGTRGGVYLEYGSRAVAITNSCFEDTSNTWVREFIAVDASTGNRIEGNLFYGNPKGAVKLYKNCSEGSSSPTQFPRREPADNNRILNNAIVGLVSTHEGVSIAARRWEDLAEAECEDPFVTDSGGNRHYRDYARNNEVAGNVFFTPGVAVRVRDSGNHVHDNFVYVKNAKTTATFLVGHVLDPELNAVVTGVELRRNWIEIQDAATRPTTIRPNVVRFVGESRRTALFIGNIFEEAPMCATPFQVASTNVAGDACRMGTLDADKVYIEPNRVALSDGGDIHGLGTFDCTASGWKAVSGYCCSGTNCTHTSIAGRFYQ